MNTVFNTSYSVKIPPAKYPFINNNYQWISINKVTGRLCIIIEQIALVLADVQSFIHISPVYQMT